MLSRSGAGSFSSDQDSAVLLSFLSLSRRPFLRGWTGPPSLRECRAAHHRCRSSVLSHGHCCVCLQVKASHFEGLITTILGYILLAGALIACHVSIHTCWALA